MSKWSMTLFDHNFVALIDGHMILQTTHDLARLVLLSFLL